MLVNGGSPDTEQFEQAIQGYDQRLIYLAQKNQGPSAARNTGIRAAHAKYVACLDSNDVFLPEHLARLLSHLETNGLDLAYCDVHIKKQGVLGGQKVERQAQNPPVTFE